ncbi:MAG: SAM-dependent DNA methyltransferase, partial [Cyanobacteria bacterium CRU_2_1]|nr:SAM-dependent DNA methyltransferase [Cyanobacteria bacterium CRU_2_1]
MFGQPDTYVFFLKLGVELLSTGGKLGFITPNTYLMGTNTAALRKELLDAGRIEQIVDLPQGIWSDATVDCVLLFLTQETDEGQRETNQPQVNLLGIRDTLDKLTTRSWDEVIHQQQSRWLNNSRNEISIRYDSLMQ